jgi:hypothetical protein
VIGEILHAIMQRINETPSNAQGSARDWRRAFDDVVEAMRVRLGQSRSGRHLGDPLLWPELTSVYRRMTDVLERRRRDGGGSGVTVHAEEEVHSQDGVLFGRLDAYFVHADGIDLVDYKSGAVLEGDEAKQDYVEQLYFYAYLLEEKYGRYPRSLSLIGRDNVSVQIEPAAARSRALAAEMRTVLSAYNSRTSAAAVDVPGLARPSALACASCDMKPACIRFWEALAGIELPVWGHVAVGKLAPPVVRSRLGACSFDLEVERSSLGVPTLKVTRVFEERFPALELDRSIGRMLMVTGLRQPSQRTPTVTEATDRCQIVTLEPEG